MSFEKSLIDYLQQIPDPRHPLWLILLLTIMGIMIQVMENKHERKRNCRFLEIALPQSWGN